MNDQSNDDVADAYIFRRQPSPLEAAISQAANDLKVTGFGQRTRATLRRNQSAGCQTILPHASYKDVVGPDLVRELNALHLMMNSERPNALTLTRLDRELVAVLDGQLETVRAIVATLWSGPLGDCAVLFLDYDNVPIPFCPMYPDARDLISDSHTVLPPPLMKTVLRLKDEIEKTEAMKESLEHLPDISQSMLQHLKSKKEGFVKAAKCRHGETIGDWQERIHDLISEGRSVIPPSLVQLNRLIHITVLCAVSLAVWDYTITTEDVSSCARWGLDTIPTQADYESETPIEPEHIWPYGPEIPSGYELRIVNTDLMFLPFDTCLRLQAQGNLRGIAIAIGESMSWRQGQDIDSRLRIAEYSSYELGRVERT